MRLVPISHSSFGRELFNLTECTFESMCAFYLSSMSIHCASIYLFMVAEVKSYLSSAACCISSFRRVGNLRAVGSSESCRFACHFPSDVLNIFATRREH
jgi:hypothetical protein